MPTFHSKPLENFLVDILPKCKEEFKKNKRKYEDEIYQPIIRDGKYVETIKKRTTDFDYLISEIKKRIEKVDPTRTEYSIVCRVLKNNLKTHLKNSGLSTTVDAERIAREEVLNFLLQYSNHSSNFVFKKELFKKLWKKFTRYLTDDLFSIFYFTPLHNFNGDFTVLKLNQDAWIRRISQAEFGVVSGIIDGQNTKPDPSMTGLRYILVTKIQKKENQKNLNIAKETFERVTNLLKIFKSGEISPGGIYYFNSENWTVDNPKKVEKEYHNPSGKIYYLSSKETSAFKKMFTKFEDLDFSKNENTFLRTAIRRFGIAIDQRTFEDKIVDYVISFESLFSAKGIDIQHKMSNRIALLLGKNNQERVDLFHFIKKSYDIRSRIVHGDQIKNIKIQEKPYSMEKIVTRLDEIARESVKCFPSLIKKYGKKDDIHNEIDISGLDNKVLKTLHKTKSR